MMYALLIGAGIALVLVLSWCYQREIKERAERRRQIVYTRRGARCCERDLAEMRDRRKEYKGAILRNDRQMELPF